MSSAYSSLPLLAFCACVQGPPAGGAGDTDQNGTPATLIATGTSNGGCTLPAIETCSSCQVTVDYSAGVTMAGAAVAAVDVKDATALWLSLPAADAVSSSCAGTLTQSTITEFRDVVLGSTTLALDVGAAGTSVVVTFHDASGRAATVVLEPIDGGSSTVIVPE